MPNSSYASADAATLAVPPTAAWMPPEPPPPGDLGPTGPVPEVHKACRDQFGRFIKDNSGGPGNPNSRRTAALRKALCDAVTAEDMYKVGKFMLQKALAGDVQAAKFLASYVIGRPGPAADPDRLDLEELRQYQEERAATRTLNDDIEGIAPGLACHLISTVWPIKTVNLASMVGQAVDTGVVPASDAAPHSDADDARHDRGPGSRPNGANGGTAANQSPTPAGGAAPTGPSAIVDNGPAAPAPRPAAYRRRRPPMTGSPGAAELLDPHDPRSANGPIGGRPGSAPRSAHGGPPTQTGQSAAAGPDRNVGDQSPSPEDSAGPRSV